VANKRAKLAPGAASPGPQEPASPIATEIASANSASSGMCVTTPASGSKLNLQACSPTTATPANTWHIE